jgi:adenosylmethionine-8-amino-7-oxononanoate aminotransferase
MATGPLSSLDRDHLIHPVSNFRAHEKKGVTVLQSGHGAYLRDASGNELLDAFAGLWCVNVGYGQESIVQVATEQMRRLPYATGYFDYGSEPAIKLAAKLVELAPASLRHVYFTLGGSDAIDSAIRYITYYYNAIGQPQRKHFISLHRGYHGSSSMGSGLTGLAAFHRNFDAPFANQHHIAPPYVYRSPAGPDPEAVTAASVAALRAKVQEIGQDKVAALFCEPIMGSGGVLVPPKGWLKAMRDTCTELGILLLADEVITGFGRTGPLFACQGEGVEPDLMTIAKGLTSGYAPMGALLMSDRIYNTIADNTPTDALIGHGYTYSGHPVSAAIGLEVMRLYYEGGLLANGVAQAPHFAAGLNSMLEHPLVGDARHRGLLGAIELVANKRTKQGFAPELRLNERLSQAAYRNGVIFRVFADNIIGFAPALCFTRSDFDLLFLRLRKTLDEMLEHADVRAAIQ